MQQPLNMCQALGFNALSSMAEEERFRSAKWGNPTMARGDRTHSARRALARGKKNTCPRQNGKSPFCGWLKKMIPLSVQFRRNCRAEDEFLQPMPLRAFVGSDVSTSHVGDVPTQMYNINTPY